MPDKIKTPAALAALSSRPELPGKGKPGVTPDQTRNPKMGASQRQARNAKPLPLPGKSRGR